MSIYRNLGHAVSYDLRLVDDDAGENAPCTQAAATNAVPRTLDWSKLRRAAPAGELLRSTVAWHANLPAEIRPKALLASYPRLANALCAAWRDPQLFEEFIGELLIDRRGHRKGFPPNVLRDLLALRAHFQSLHPDACTQWQVPLPWEK